MFNGIQDREFVEQSIKELDEAANSVKQGMANVTQCAAAMTWEGADRRRFDEKQGAFLAELRQVELTLRATAGELENILRDQGFASQS